MRYKSLVIILLITLAIFTGCKQTIPNAQPVITTIPAHLIDVIETIQSNTGVYVFDAKQFGTDKDTYVLISHGNKDNKMVQVSSMEFNKTGELELTLEETDAAQPHSYTVIKLEDYNGKVAIANPNGKWPTISTSNMQIASRGKVIKVKKNNLQLDLDNAIMNFTLSDEVLDKVNENKITLNKDSELVVYYQIKDNNLVASDLKAITDSGSLKGIFVGYIDSQSIEVKVDGKPSAYRLSQTAKQNLEEKDLESGDSIQFNYYVIENKTYFITKIER